MARDPLDALVDSAVRETDNQTGGSDAAEALLDPDKVERMRDSARTRRPPSVRRPPVQDVIADDDDDSDDDSGPAQKSRGGKYEKYYKRDLIAEAERLQQELDDERARAAERDAQATTDPEALGEAIETVAFLARYTFSLAAAIRGPHWTITDAEAERIGQPGGKLLAMFAGDFPAWLLPAVAFSTALGGTVAQKIVEERRIKSLPIDPEAK